MFDPQPGFDFRPLGNWEPKWSVYADCGEPGCWNSKKLDRAALIAKYSEGLLIGDLKRMLRCSKCGSDRVRIMFVWNVNYREPATDQ